MAGFDPDVFSGGAAQGPGYDADVFKSDVKPVTLTATPKQTQGSGNALVDAGNALGTGYFQGLTRLAGLPVDTVANVFDLGKAAIGSGYQAITGKPAPDALQLTDRSNVVGSGDWLLRKAQQTAPGRVLTQPVNPDYQGGYIQAAGAGLTGVMGPQTGLQAANQALIGTTSALGGKATMDATGNPALAITASLAPSGIQQGLTAGTKAAIRGGEQGRRDMEQRAQDLKNAGIENPTLGLASGNKVVGGVENILQNTPGAVGVMSKARDAALGGLRGTTEEAANLSSPNRGALESGVAIQKGIQGFKDQYKSTQGALYGKLDQYIDPQDPATILATRERLNSLNADIKGAENVSKFFQNEKMKSLQSALEKDTAGAPKSVQVYQPAPITGAKAVEAALQSGKALNTPLTPPQIQVVIPEGPPRNTLPFEAVKKMRTLVGNEIADNSLLSSVPNSKWRSLYGALSEDIGTTARENSPGAERAFNRATDYTRAGAQRLERVSPFAQTTAPEQAYTALVNASKENVSTLQAVKKTLPPDARGTIAGTVIERLGRANNGVQNESGTAWSPETFLTNWNKMTPRGREELFSGFPNSSAVRQNVENVAKAASMMRDSSKMWANPSGTGANVAARATIAGLLGGGGASAIGLLNPAVPLAVGGGLLGANLLARGATSPTVVNAIARRTYVSPQMLNAQFNSLVAPGLLSQ